jgi:hypothetical protein
MYWAAFYGKTELVICFLNFLGISPFAKLFKGKGAVDAAILGEQYELLELLIKDTKAGAMYTNK